MTLKVVPTLKAHSEPQHLEQCAQVHPPPLRPHLRRQAAQQVHCGQGPLGGAGDDAHANDVNGDIYIMMQCLSVCL